MGCIDCYPLWSGYDNADEIEVSTETLEKYLAGEITMDDVDFSQHKLLKSDMEAVKKLKKEPYDDFSLDKWNLDSDLAKTNLPVSYTHLDVYKRQIQGYLTIQVK